MRCHYRFDDPSAWLGIALHLPISAEILLASQRVWVTPVAQAKPFPVSTDKTAETIDKTAETIDFVVLTERVYVRALTGLSAWTELFRYRQLLVSLAWRDVRVRYKQSLLGISWAILLPVSMMLIFTFVFTRAIDASALIDVRMPYALFAYTGLVPWTFFSMSLTGCVNSLVANRNLVTKVYFPREVFPLSCVASSMVDFVVAMSVLAGLMAYFHFRGSWTFTLHGSLLFLPVVVLVQITLTIGLGMILAMANLFYRDVRQVVGVGVQLWMFVSAVVVPVPQDGSLLAKVLSVNPLVGLIGAYRDCVLLGRLPEPKTFGYCVVFALVVLVVGWYFFRRASRRFAECI